MGLTRFESVLIIIYHFFSSARTTKKKRKKRSYARIVLAITKSDEFPVYSDLQVCYKSQMVTLYNAFPNIPGISTCLFSKIRLVFFFLPWTRATSRLIIGYTLLVVVMAR